MAKSKSENDKEKLYEYNIYRFNPNNKRKLTNYLKEKTFRKIPLIISESNGYSIELWFCNKPNNKGIPWIKMLSQFTTAELPSKQITYGAALFYYKEDSFFALSYGNAHFYLSDFCDYHFGLDIAERIMDMDAVNSQQVNSHGSRKSKTLTDYIGSSSLSLQSSETPSFATGATLEPAVWGDKIACGFSTKFRWTISPLGIGSKLSLIEKELKKKPVTELPRSSKLDENTDAELIEQLYKELGNAIMDYDGTRNKSSMINVPSFFLSGTAIIQNDYVSYSLSYKRKREDIGNLTIEAIRDFAKKNKLDLSKTIKDIKLIANTADGHSQIRPVTKFIEYINENNYFIKDGRWESYNEAFLAILKKDVDSINFNRTEDDEFAISREETIKYGKDNGLISESNGKHDIETAYNNLIAGKLGLKCNHPNTIKVDPKTDKKTKYEVCDLFDDKGNLYFVKIGEAADFAAAADQANNTLSLYRTNVGQIKITDNESIQPTALHLILIFQDRNRLEKLSELSSLNLLNHLSDLKNNTRNKNLRLNLHLVYWKKGHK